MEQPEIIITATVTSTSTPYMILEHNTFNLSSWQFDLKFVFV